MSTGTSLNAGELLLALGIIVGDVELLFENLEHMNAV